MKVNVLLGALGLAAAACEDHCAREFGAVSYCMADRRLYPDYCSASCGREAPQMRFLCDLGAQGALHRCSQRCLNGGSKAAKALSVREEGLCPLVYRPLCAEGGLTYFNDCHRRAGKQALADRDVCEEKEKPCATTAAYKPVCGADGKTYANRALADCAKVAVKADARCPAGL